MINISEKVISFCDILNSDNKYKNINVLWSGGCDSTLVLHDILKTLKNVNDYRTVHTFSFSHSQFSDVKMKKEAEHREKYIKYAKSKKFNDINHVNIPIFHGNIEVEFGNHFCCPQPCMWLTQILPFMRNSTLLFTGYHRGDDFFTYNVFQNWLKIFDGMIQLLGSKDVTIVTPLESQSKYDIVERLKNNKIYNFTWHCETPINEEPCGTCIPCITHKQAVLLYNHNKRHKKLSQIGHLECKELDCIPMPEKTQVKDFLIDEKIDTNINKLVDICKDVVSPEKVI